MFSKASTFSITMQQTSLSRWNPMIASLSLGFIFAFSLSSFGRTICPFASTVTTASILQHSLLQDSFSVIGLFTNKVVIVGIFNFFLKIRIILQLRLGKEPNEQPSH